MIVALLPRVSPLSHRSREPLVQPLLPLPGELAVEPHLLDSAVLEVNRLCTAKGLETARSIGEYVLARFFDGDVAAFHSRCRTHQSFEALRARGDLRVSASFLWYSVSVVDQLRKLPPDVAMALPMSHHRILLHVHDESTKAALAREAVTSHLSRRSLEERVRQIRRTRPAEPRTGRPAQPAFVKAFHHLDIAREQAATERVRADDLRHLSVDRLLRLLADAEDALSALEETIDAVREALERKAHEGQE